MFKTLTQLFGSKGDSKSQLPESQQTIKKNFQPSALIADTEFVAFDTELTGLDFKSDSIISIGAVKLQGSKIFPARMFYRLVQPQSVLKGKSVVVHEITHSDLEDAEPVERVMNDFLEYINQAVLIGHFVHIDLNFVNRALKQIHGTKLQNYAVDTSSLHDWLYEYDSGFARHHGGMTAESDLYSMAKRYGIVTDKAHNALGDALLTAQLFQRFIFFLPDAGVTTIKDLLTVAKP